MKSWLARRCLRIADGEVEVDPLADAEREFVFVLEAFEDEEVFPVGDVLDGGDAVGEGVRDGELEGPGGVSSSLGGGMCFVDEGAGGRLRG